jgi:cyclophilin family peptidyl-prolyl cis-trans isomerase/HEAT repeat protein
MISIRPVATLLTLAGVLLATPATLPGQDIEVLALILEAEDSRRWDAPLFESSINHPAPLVRRTAAMAIGRIGDWRGTPLLQAALLDPDTTVQTAVIFGLGLLEDPQAVPDLIERLRAQPAISAVPAAEAITSLARIGGSEAAAFIRTVIDGSSLATTENPEDLLRQALTDVWWLGDEAPVTALAPYADGGTEDLRSRALYSLWRLEDPTAGSTFLRALGDRSPSIRAIAAGVLTSRYAADAGMESGTATDLLMGAVSDENARVRVNALRALGTYRDPATAPAVIVALDDPDFNVQVQAAWALGLIGGPTAGPELSRVLLADRNFALGREALIGLARSDSAAFVAAAGSWSGSGDWRRRAAAAEGWERVAPGPAEGKPRFLLDSDARVVASSLRAWVRFGDGADPALLAEARRLSSSPDAVVRTAAAQALGSAADPEDVGRLATMFTLAERDSFPDASWAALDALLTVAETSQEGESAVLLEFLGRSRRPENYLVRGWAEDNWPAAFARWGPAYPIETELSLQDYRAVAERFLVNQGEAYPHVLVETENAGILELELFGPDAPLTVQRFLALVDRQFFNGLTWHRVVPDYVVQTGDPRGDGWGVAPGAVRDEINRRDFRSRTVGMATSGPDTGSSQWFITLSPQQRLDGSYTAFGRIVGQSPGLPRITEGDRIRTIRR